MKFLISLFLLSITWHAHAELIDRSLSVDPKGELHIEITDGAVDIEVWNKSEIKIEGSISRKPDEFVFETHGNNTRVELSGNHNSWWGNDSASAELMIYIPQETVVIADGVSVSFSFDGIKRRVRANTISGNISLKNGNGKIDLNSVSGDIQVSDSVGKFDLASVSGDIDVNGDAKYFDASTVSGSIEADVGMVDRIEVETVSGDIELELGLLEGARLEGDTVSGDIEITFSNGKINSAFDIETGPGGRVKNRLSGDRMNENMRFSGSLNFSLGNGDGSVNLETMSGTIVLDQ